jgi:outer membrane protein
MLEREKILQRQHRLTLVLMLIGLLPALGYCADSQSPPPQAATQLAQAKDPNVLTLDEALLTALANHPSLSAARERVAAQRAVLGQQTAAYYPIISATGQYRTTTESGTTSIAPNGFDFFNSQLTFNMILYNFGKREGAVQAARETLSATDYNYKTTVDAVVLGVKQAYYFYLGARAIVNVREDTVKSRDLLVKQTQGFYNVGTRARIDVVRAEANLYTAQADLIAATNAVQIAWVNLKNAMGLRELPERPLAEEANLTTIPYTLEEAREIAYATRPELKSFDAQLRAQDQNIAVARRGHLPDLIFDANWRRSNVSNGVTADSVCTETLFATDSQGNSTSFCAKKETITHSVDTFPLRPAWQVQLSLNIPIFDGFRTTNRVDESLHTYYVIKAQEEQQRQQVALDVEQAYLTLVQLQQRIKANEAAAAAAKENLDLANGRYQVGVGSIIEVTDAQQLYTDAQTTYVRTLYDYKIADAQLTRAIGK